MEQILVTIDDTQPSASIRNAIKMLRGVVSASIIKRITFDNRREAECLCQGKPVTGIARGKTC